MNTAGTPAEPPLEQTPSGWQPNAETDLPSSTIGPDHGPDAGWNDHTEDSAGAGLAAFLAEGTRRRARHTREESERPESWADPDPTAAATVALGNPIDRVIARYRVGKSRNEIIGALRRTCERLQGLAPRSLTHEQVRAFPWHQLSVAQAITYREAMYERFAKQSSRNDSICPARAVVRECYRAGLISALRRDQLLEELYTAAPGPSTRRRRLSQPEVTALLDTCENVGTPAARARDTAMVATFRTTGMRVSELTRLELEDWDREEATLRLRGTKNGRDHLVFLHPDALPYLERWVALRGDRPGALFTPLKAAEPRHLHTSSVRYILAERAKAAGVAPFGTHDFRRTFATELLRTHDIALVGKLLNHRKTESTMVYDLAGEDEQREAVGHIQLPVLDGDAVDGNNHTIGDDGAASGAVA